MPPRRQADVRGCERVLADAEDGADEPERLGEAVRGDLLDDAPPDGFLEDVDRRLDLLEPDPLAEALPRDLPRVGQDGLEVPHGDRVEEEGEEARESAPRLLVARRLVARQPATGHPVEGLREDGGLVALQEVDVGAGRTGRVDQALELARLTGMHVLYGATMPFQGGQYGNALLSRWPAAGFRNHALPVTPGREPRAILDAEFRHPAAFRILATHFDITRPDRVSAVEALSRMAPPADSAPAILLGDLNDTPDSPVLGGLFSQGWRSAVAGFTIPVREPRRQIDFILYRPAGRWKVIEQRVLEEPSASDHLPVLAVLELTP